MLISNIKDAFYSKGTSVDTQTDSYKDSGHTDRFLQRQWTHRQILTKTVDTQTDSYKDSGHTDRFLQRQWTHRQILTKTTPHEKLIHRYGLVYGV